MPYWIASEYSYVQHGRDLRLDFLRGLVMIVVICVHLEYLSLLSVFMWERLGMISSAEGFVALSGVVLGIVNKKRLIKEGFQAAALKLVRRAGQLYIVNIIMVLSILLFMHIPSIDMNSITHWVSPAGGPSHPLFPAEGSPWQQTLRQLLLLEIGPHQFRVIGLYAFLIAWAPFVLYLLDKHYTAQLLALSWGAYIINMWIEIRITNAGFEYAFPVLTWQMLFYNGIILGFHYEKVFVFCADHLHKHWIYLAVFFSTLFMLFALANPEPVFWPWATWQVFTPLAYKKIYMTWFYKSSLGIGRIINNVLFYTTLFAFINWHWQHCYRWFGWLLIPIGQASLYVFIWHVYLVLFWNNTPLPGYHNFWLNTLIHILSIGLIWTMVKKEFLFALVPR